MSFTCRIRSATKLRYNIQTADISDSRFEAAPIKKRGLIMDIRKIQEQILFDAIKAASDEKTAAETVYGETGLASSEDDPAWVRSAMNNLENRFDKDKVRQIRMDCQCGYGMDEKLEFLKELAGSSSSLEEFANHDKTRAAGMYRRNDELYLEFHSCTCPMLAEVDKLDSDAWCQCTAGYSKTLFEKAFGCKVDVELLKSIKTGDDICLQRIILHDPVWK